MLLSYSLDIKLSASHLAAQGDYLDHFQTCPASLDNLIHTDWISFLQNIFILFLFVDKHVNFIIASVPVH